jgi:hypothetical protein
MKTMKWIILATLLISGSTLMAQTTRTNIHTDQTFKQISQLLSSLNLSNEQLVKIMAINQKYARLEASNKTNTELSKREVKKGQKKLDAARAKEVESVLKGNTKMEGKNADQALIEQGVSSAVAFSTAFQTIYFGANAL